MKQNRRDPVIDEIREIRHSISERFDHDPEQLVAYYMEMQGRYRNQLVDKSEGYATREPLAV
jgi:hypothetical protein